MCIFLSEKCRNVFGSCHQLQQAPGRLDPRAFHLPPSPARKFPQKTLTNSCPSGNIYRQSVRLRIEYGRVPEWPMGTDCKSAAFSFGGSNPPAPTKKTSVENTLVFCFIRYLKFHFQGWIRTTAEPTAACGGNREARLGQRSAFSKPCQGAAEKAASATRKARRMVRRAKKPLRGFFRCAARDIHPRPPKKLNVSRCIPLFLFHLSLKAALPCRVTKKDALRSLAKRLCL